MGLASRFLASALLLAALTGCKGAQPLPELEGGAEMALRRGAAWSTLKVRPPYAIGSRVNLHFRKHGVVSGHIESAPPVDQVGRMESRMGAVNLTINEDGIQGSGPFGAVAVDVEEGPETLTFEGTWNDSRVSFKITNESFNGTISIRRFGRIDTIAGITSCQYVLDHTTPDGAREGTSICSGLPEPTRLEIPRQVHAFLTRKELVVVLLALLSTPPQTSLEGVP